MVGAYRLLVFLVSALFLSGCAGSYHWSKAHPAYSKAPYGELTVVAGPSVFVLTRTAWFANRLDIPNDSIQLKITALASQYMLEELKGGYSTLNVLPDSTIPRLPEESLKIDDRIFLKGKFPEQGVALKNADGSTPPTILLVHEVIIGTDLKREVYFDYSLIHNEAQVQKAVKNISAIVSYTLWDNEKQRPLFSAIDEINHPVSQLSLEDIRILIRKAVQQIRTNLYTGGR